MLRASNVPQVISQWTNKVFLISINSFHNRRKGELEQAETFLQDALKSYVTEGWSLPVTHTRKQIAECQKLLGRTDEYPSKHNQISTFQLLPRLS